MSLLLAWALIPCWFSWILMHFDNIFNNGSINKISSRNRCTRYTRFILGKPSWGRKTQQAFSLRVSSTMSSRQTLACLRNEPRRVKVLSLVQEQDINPIQEPNTKYKALFTSALEPETKCATLGERNSTKCECMNEWNGSDSLLYLYKYNHVAYQPSRHENNIIIKLLQ